MQSCDQKNPWLYHEKKSIYEDEKSYCEYMKYIFEKEPYETDFEISAGLTQFFIKHNDDKIDVFEEMLSEFNECLDIRGLTVKKWRPFTCRPLELFFSDYKYCVLFESINQDCIDLLKTT